MSVGTVFCPSIFLSNKLSLTFHSLPPEGLTNTLECVILSETKEEGV